MLTAGVGDRATMVIPHLYARGAGEVADAVALYSAIPSRAAKRVTMP